MKHIDLKHGEYEITLLTVEEYKRYKPQIPHVNDWWWLRSPGCDQDYAADVSSAGVVSLTGYGVDSDYGAVRPALRSKIIDLSVGEQVIALGNRWTVIDTGLAISNEVVARKRFDGNSNDWETSELKEWLEEWAREGDYDVDFAKDTNAPTNDCISRQAAIDAILHNQDVYSNSFGNDPIDRYAIAIIDNDAQTIAQLPSAQPTSLYDRRVGKWNIFYDDDCPQDGIWECSACGHIRLADDITPTNFCPNCGADMRGENNDDNRAD